MGADIARRHLGKHERGSAQIERIVSYHQIGSVVLPQHCLRLRRTLCEPTLAQMFAPADEPIRFEQDLTPPIASPKAET